MIQYNLNYLVYIQHIFVFHNYAKSFLYVSIITLYRWYKTELSLYTSTQITRLSFTYPSFTFNKLFIKYIYYDEFYSIYRYIYKHVRKCNIYIIILYDELLFFFAILELNNNYN